MTVQVKPYGAGGWRIIRLGGNSHGHRMTKPDAVKRAREVVYEHEPIEVLKRDGSLQRVIGREHCPRCEAHDEVRAGRTHEICRLKGIGYYDATCAADLVRRLARRGELTPTYIPTSTLYRMVSENAVHMPHTAHVNPRKYLIVGTYVEPGEGERQFLLDGSHRAFYRSRCHQGAWAYVLTLEQTLTVFDGKRPPTGKAFVTR